ARAVAARLSLAGPAGDFHLGPPRRESGLMQPAFDRVRHRIPRCVLILDMRSGGRPDAAAPKPTALYRRRSFSIVVVMVVVMMAADDDPARPDDDRAMMMVMVVTIVAMMVMMPISRHLHLARLAQRLLVARRRIGRPQRRQRIRNRVEQL